MTAAVTKRIDPLCEAAMTVGCADNVNAGKYCSPIFSKTEIGDYCRWQFAALSPGDRDTVVEDYCLKYPDSTECKCVNRSDDADYKKLKLNNPYSDKCWYLPCSDRLKYFVTSDFDRAVQCPSNICQIVYDIAQVHDVDLSGVGHYINCDFNNGGVIPSPNRVPLALYGAIVLVILAFIYVYYEK